MSNDYDDVPIGDDDDLIDPGMETLTLEEWAGALKHNLFNEYDGDAYYVTANDPDLEVLLEDWHNPPADAVAIIFYGK